MPSETVSTVDPSYPLSPGDSLVKFTFNIKDKLYIKLRVLNEEMVQLKILLVGVTITVISLTVFRSNFG